MWGLSVPHNSLSPEDRPLLAGLHTDKPSLLGGPLFGDEPVTTKTAKKPALSVRFTITPNADGTATVTAEVLRQTVRQTDELGPPETLFGKKGPYAVSSVANLAIEGETLYLHGTHQDRQNTTNKYDDIASARAAVSAWTKIIAAYVPPKPAKPAASKSPKPPKPIVTVAKSKG